MSDAVNVNSETGIAERLQAARNLPRGSAADLTNKRQRDVQVFGCHPAGPGYAPRQRRQSGTDIGRRGQADEKAHIPPLASAPQRPDPNPLSGR